ncbi:PP1-complex regulatory subunit GLC8 KNAG_0E01230 [Huiozyma naganishii CBS 8797]|uniref:Protein GLC8 n=1 Tax=Huiozyma naganishii (strain ATCC MYA-139 / BCRC 22969 / CBS 8797 / KCTC 17520 / NBRC 10181 / NCYC 3082 / Yp74L-3) TaxID=1071383 RepID=J7S6H7_HUIN7|nr:hypothetical protein KNAG_0E01230 [Kazachstania naganishii CBS 8797]CCK70389.1 hypothetical protein KNAG_0E01230 [Kazachstania naganishii CBS 8797]
MGGILKNPLPREQVTKENEDESLVAFRKRVFDNTQLNAKLSSHQNSKQFNAHVPRDTISLKHAKEHGEGQEAEGAEEGEDLRWNHKNLEDNEVTKQQFQDIHIDEPKTPYQGAVDPQGEYYRVDDEDDLNNFTLGEAEVEVPSREETPSDNAEEEESQGDQDPEEETPEARHKRFEEMRKKHYNVREIFQHKKQPEEDEEEEDDDENSKTDS